MNFLAWYNASNTVASCALAWRTGSRIYLPPVYEPYAAGSCSQMMWAHSYLIPISKVRGLVLALVVVLVLVLDLLGFCGATKADSPAIILGGFGVFRAKGARELSPGWSEAEPWVYVLISAPL
jgi:hypothetical protein